MSRRQRTPPPTVPSKAAAPPEMRLELAPLPPPSRRQRWLLAGAILLELVWIAILALLAATRAR